MMMNTPLSIPFLSGGEWLSTVALESALLAHAGVAEAVVVAVPHADLE